MVGRFSELEGWERGNHQQGFQPRVVKYGCKGAPVFVTQFYKCVNIRYHYLVKQEKILLAVSFERTTIIYLYTRMKWILVENTEHWDSWLLEHKNEEFLQCFEWGEFQASEGKSVLCIAGYEGERLVYQAQGFIHTLVLGFKYVYFPHNPPLGEYAEGFLNFVGCQGFVFARFEPIENFISKKFKQVATHHRQYQYTSLIDLAYSDEQLLKSFHEKTRYNIRLAAKKGVVIKNEKNAEIFWPLLQETYTRDKIKSHSEKYYRDFIDLLSCTQLTAYSGEIPLASVLLITFGHTCVYVHGASSNTNRNLMAPYLIQWEAMQLARAQGCYFYDLGGVAKPGDQHDKLAGVTRFKAGFNGTIKHYGAASDIVFDSLKYNLYKLARKFL